MNETTKKVMIDHEMKTADKARAATTPEVAAKRSKTIDSHDYVSAGKRLADETAPAWQLLPVLEKYRQVNMLRPEAGLPPPPSDHLHPTVRGRRNNVAYDRPVTRQFSITYYWSGRK